MYDRNRTEQLQTVTEVGTREDHYFKARLRKEGWDIRNNETVTDFIKRTGHPFHISYDEREDN
jgi:hypothetical protein